MMNVLSLNRKELENKTPTVITYKTVGNKQLRLYVYFPVDKPLSCVLCIHGGGWNRETPKRLFPHAAYFAENGAIGISVEYRLIDDDVDIRDGLEDCVDALEFIRKRLVAKYDKLSIISFGDSAGAYFATCLGNSAIMTNIAKNVKIVDYVIDLNGIVDLTGKWGYGIHTNDLEILKRFSPLYNLTNGDAPTLMIHGDADNVVSIDDSKRYYASLQKVNVDCIFKRLPNIAHAFILFDYRYEDSFVEKILMEIATVLQSKKYLK